MVVKTFLPEDFPWTFFPLWTRVKQDGGKAGVLEK